MSTTWPPDIGVKPYYSDDAVVIYHADCRDILPLLPKVDLVLTDPPYGIGKAEWDDRFEIEWLDLVDPLTYKVGLMCGTWNIVKCPPCTKHLHYRWTLAAHLVNGMTRGALGFGNWIPCIVYSVDYSCTEYRQSVLKWCREFGDWCRKNKIRNSDLDAACGTSSMGDWWTGRSLPWVQLPKSEFWQSIRAKFHPPTNFDTLPESVEYIPNPQQDCKDFVVGTEPKPDHPSPKPLRVVSWFIDTIGGKRILDPFMGSGTTLRAAKDLGRKAIGIEIEEQYCEIAAKRMSQTVLGLEVQ